MYRLVGYTDDAYRLWNPNTREITISYHFRFDADQPGGVIVDVFQD